MRHADSFGSCFRTLAVILVSIFLLKKILFLCENVSGFIVPLSSVRWCVCFIGIKNSKNTTTNNNNKTTYNKGLVDNGTHTKAFLTLHNLTPKTRQCLLTLNFLHRSGLISSNLLFFCAQSASAVLSGRSGLTIRAIGIKRATYYQRLALALSLSLSLSIYIYIYIYDFKDVGQN